MGQAKNRRKEIEALKNKPTVYANVLDQVAKMTIINVKQEKELLNIPATTENFVKMFHKANTLGQERNEEPLFEETYKILSKYSTTEILELLEVWARVETKKGL